MVERESWSAIATRAAIHGGVAGIGGILQGVFETGAMATFGYIIVFAAFITFFFPLKGRRILLGFPVFLVSAGIVLVVGLLVAL